MHDTILSKDTICATVGDDHTYDCAVVTIGRTGENGIAQLEITIPAELSNFWAYLDFKKPNGSTFKTPRLEIVNNTIEYDIPAGLVDGAGNIETQLVLQNADGRIWKSTVKKYVVLKSIDATDDIPDKEDFITNAQKLLDSLSLYAGKPDQSYNPESENAQSGVAVAEAINETVGNIETALDNIIAIQEELIGGESE